MFNNKVSFIPIHIIPFFIVDNFCINVFYVYTDIMQKEQEYTLPQHSDSEIALLGSILLDTEAWDNITQIKKEMFYVPKNQILFECMNRLVKECLPIDLVTMTKDLEEHKELDLVGGREYLCEIINSVPSASHIDAYAKNIINTYMRRELMKAGANIIKVAEEGKKDIDGIKNDVEHLVFKITNDDSVQKKYKQLSTLVEPAFKKILETKESDLYIRGVDCGFKSLNDKLSGFQPSDLIILAARPSAGKTTLALDMARNISVNKNVSVGFFSLEMSGDQVIEKMLATESNVDAWKLRTGRLNDDEKNGSLKIAVDKLSKAPFYIDDKANNSIVAIRSTARKMKRENKIDILFVDYLQLITPHDTIKSDSMVNKVTEISRELKQIARELEIPVIALSQLSREIDKRGGEPRLSDLRDSGSIEQDADVVMFIHQQKNEVVMGGEVEEKQVIIAKHRNGAVGRVVLMFDKKRVSFSDAERKYK